MEAKALHTSQQRAQRERWILYAIIGTLLLVVLMQQYKINVSHERIVLEAPFRQHPQYTVSWDHLGESYGKEWALYVATLAGNVGPGNVDFVTAALDRVFHPSLRDSVRVQLMAEAETMKKEGYTIAFEPAAVRYDETTGVASVTGRQIEKTLTGDVREGKAEYQMTIAVHMGMPRITAYRIANGVDEDA